MCFTWARSSVAERPAHNRSVVGSNPTGPTKIILPKVSQYEIYGCFTTSDPDLLTMRAVSIRVIKKEESL